MLDKLGCFAMGFVFAVVLGIVNAEVRAEFTGYNNADGDERAPLNFSLHMAQAAQRNV